VPRPQQSTLGVLNFEKIVRGDICGGLGDDFRVFVMRVEIEGCLGGWKRGGDEWCWGRVCS